MNPKVSIIILNWNGLDDTIECLDSLKKTTYPDYEVIVVDNGSKGDDAEILGEKYKDYIHIVENDKNYGFAEGCNIGMRYALKNSHPDYILLLNNDTVVAPDFLNKLIDVAEKDVSIGIAGPKIYFYDQPNKLQSAGARVNWWTGETALIGYGEIDNGQFGHLKDVDWVIGGALLIKRQVLEKIGLLYQPYFAYFEEADWCARCRKAGYRVVYVPGAKVWHKGQRTIGKQDVSLLYYMTRNRLLFMRRNSTTLQFVCFLMWFSLKDSLVTTIMLIRRKELKSLTKFYKAICDGMRLSFCP